MGELSQILQGELFSTACKMAAVREFLPKNHRLILFQRAKSEGSARFIENKKKRKGPENTEALTGEEAKSFYEDIVASSSVADDETKYRRQPNAKNVTQTSKQRSRKRRKETHQTETVKGKDQNKEPPFTATVSAFLRFAQDGDLEGVEKYISQGGADLNATDPFGWTALMCASFAGHQSVVRCLLEHGANWREQADSRGRNALDLARKARHQNIVDLIQEFSNNGILSVAKDDQEETGQDQNGYFCGVCQQEFKETSKEDHEHSTVHLFNCQHAPPSTMYFLPESNRGFQMMLREGWDREEGLGRDGRKGQKFPVKTVLKRDRTGLGARQDYRAKVTHFSSRDTKAVKKPQESEKKLRKRTLSRRERTAKERKEKQWERDFRASFNTDF
ncbi:PREDICTED: G patch domain and ankyrin repeat-containing protein 1 homolog [Branchiostoma belcheri]|uniref:G patch domain and ankyrin repeat-containing protein 1 homolog n=1 Tax=Branchiostoma belcheri TaxID=7741 RepID=A0A6P5AHC4_BRABE|nr:PREDICTED: G patch domain and ankyrin repeat-containing protein 1 homolog [Branchiostoma belcheri]